jgi:hypothetical protein
VIQLFCDFATVNSIILWFCQQFFVHWIQPFCYSAQSFFDCYNAHPFCDFVILNSAILWFCYNYLSHFVIFLVIFYTLNSAIFATVLNHFLIATVLSQFVILLYWTRPFCYNAQPFCDFATIVILSAIFYTLSSAFFCYSAHPFFDCYNAQPFCDFVILNSSILLQCSSILWFCYNYLTHFMILSVIFYTLNSAIFATVPSHFSIAIVLSHFVIPLHWTQPFCYSAQHFIILLQLPQSFCDLVSNFYTLNSTIFLLQCLPFFDCYSA